MRRIGSKTVGECPCEYALRYIGGAWKIMIVVLLDRAKIRRHAEIKRVLQGITPKILTQQLREMERDGLIRRTVYAEVPPKVEYQLTTFGETLRPVIDAMYAWGTQTREAVSRAMLTKTNSNPCGAESQRDRVPAQPRAAARP
jgi:DNA-binding HxlR family transcriptional regulator